MKMIGKSCFNNMTDDDLEKNRKARIKHKRRFRKIEKRQWRKDQNA